VPVLDPAAPDLSAPPSAPSLPPQPQGSGPAAGQAAGLVRTIDGELIAIDTSGEAVVLAEGDAVAPGEVLISRGDGQAVIDFAGGGSLAMAGTARTEIRAADAGHAHVVAHAGAFVVAAGASGGDAGGIVIESGAAIVVLEAGALALRYDLNGGLSAAAVPGTDVIARIVNDSGVHELDPAAPAFAVANWAAPPELLSAGAGEVEWLPAELPGQAGPHAADAAGDAAQANGAAGEGAAGESPDADLGPAFLTSAGAAEDGDPTFGFPARPSGPRGLADITPASTSLLPPLPAVSGQLQAFSSPRPEPFEAGGHAIDPLVLWQAPAEPRLPPADPGPGAPSPLPPTLRGWDGKGLAWDVAGSASVCGTQREWPAWPDRPQLEIEPREGQSMAGLTAAGLLRNDLERFLGLGFDQLNTLVEGATPFNGSAIKTSVSLKAGQTLVFDVLFDADEPINSNDFAAFTVSRGGSEGEGFVLSSIAATGDFGVSPWQSLRYTAGAAGTYAIGFLVVNDKSADGPALLYVDAMRSALQAPDLHLVAEQGDGFGGRFELFSPEPEEAGGQQRLICGFENGLAWDAVSGEVTTAGQFVEPDGCRSVYSPTEGESMAVLHAYGEMRPKLEAFLGLEKAPGAVTALPLDADGTFPGFGAATRLTVAVAEGDRISFDWMFDAGDVLPDNDFAVFTVAGDGGGSRVFKLADVRATGDAGATGWRTSVYTAAEAGELTVGFAVVNDRTSGYAGDTENSRLLIDNVWLNREAAGGYQLADLADPGAMATLTAA